MCCYLNVHFQGQRVKYYCVPVFLPYVSGIRSPSSLRRIICLLWLVLLFNVFLHINSLAAGFSGKVLNVKCVFLFSLQIFYETFLILRRTERDSHKCISVCLLSTRYSSQISKILESLRQVFEEYSNIKFHENPSNRNSFRADGRVHRQDEADSRHFQFRERA